MKNNMQNMSKTGKSQKEWVPRISQRIGHSGCPYLRASLSTDDHTSQERQPRTVESKTGETGMAVGKEGHQAERW